MTKARTTKPKRKKPVNDSRYVPRSVNISEDQMTTLKVISEQSGVPVTTLLRVAINHGIRRLQSKTKNPLHAV